MIRSLCSTCFSPRLMRLGLILPLLFTSFFSLLIRIRYAASAAAGPEAAASAGEMASGPDITLFYLLRYLFHDSLLQVLFLWFFLALIFEFSRAYWVSYMLGRGSSPLQLAVHFWLAAQLLVPCYLLLILGADLLVDLAFGLMFYRAVNWSMLLAALGFEWLCHAALLSAILLIACVLRRPFIVILFTHLLILLDLTYLLPNFTVLNYFFWQQARATFQYIMRPDLPSAGYYLIAAAQALLLSALCLPALKRTAAARPGEVSWLG